MAGQQLREARRQKGLTQQRVAERLGVTQAYVAMVESDKRRVLPSMWAKFREVYDLPPTVLPLDASPTQLLDGQHLAVTLGALRYPGFAYWETTLLSQTRPWFFSRRCGSLPSSLASLRRSHGWRLHTRILTGLGC